MPEAQAFVRGRLRAEWGLEAIQIFELGGLYHPSKGLSPEIVYPLLAEVEVKEVMLRSLTWVLLRDLVENHGLIQDAHPLLLTLRTAHASHLLPTATPASHLGGM